MGNLAGLAFGAGGKAKIDEALGVLRDFARLHATADSIPVDVFGYSRGAALARAFVNAVHGDFPGGTHRWTKPANVTVRFLGLFDTVGSFGIPGNDCNPGYSLDVHADRVKRAVHFVAQHEYRHNYDLTSIKRLAAQHDKYKAYRYNNAFITKPLPPHMTERTFIGSHGDIGGGCPAGLEGKRNELSRIPLYAMIDAARTTGVVMHTPESLKNGGFDKIARYSRSFAVPHELRRLLAARSDPLLYEAQTRTDDIFHHPLYGHYVHDTRDDGIRAGATFLDRKSSVRSVFYHGVY